MPEIHIEVINKIPSVVGETKSIVADNSDYTIRFAFDDQWAKEDKTVYFVLDNGFAYSPVRTNNDMVQIPRQTEGGFCKRIYIGLEQGGIRTSRAVGLSVLSSITDMIDDDAVQPQPSLWEDVLRRLENLEKNGGGSGGAAFEAGFGLSLEGGVLSAEVGAASFHEITNAELQEIIDKLKTEG